MGLYIHYLYCYTCLNNARNPWLHKVACRDIIIYLLSPLLFTQAISLWVLLACCGPMLVIFHPISKLVEHATLSLTSKVVCIGNLIPTCQLLQMALFKHYIHYFGKNLWHQQKKAQIKIL